MKETAPSEIAVGSKKKEAEKEVSGSPAARGVS